MRRSAIERFCGMLTSTAHGLSTLPAWVRRVRLQVHAKIIIFMTAD